MQKVIVGEGQFVPNKPMIHNSSSVSKEKPFYVRRNSIPQRIQMNVMQIGARLSRELTPSPKMLRMVNGIL
jgi:hypothetical protein